MKRLLFIGFAVCAFALAPAVSASAMPVVPPGVIAVSDDAVVHVKGGHGHGRGHGWGRGHGGRHLGWSRGRGRGGCPPGLRMQGRC